MSFHLEPSATEAATSFIELAKTSAYAIGIKLVGALEERLNLGLVARGCGAALGPAHGQRRHVRRRVAALGRTHSLLASNRWRYADLRTVIVHVLIETATHAGHLDAARELIDGRQYIVL